MVFGEDHLRPTDEGWVQERVLAQALFKFTQGLVANVMRDGRQYFDALSLILGAFGGAEDASETAWSAIRRCQRYTDSVHFLDFAIPQLPEGSGDREALLNFRLEL